MGDILVLNPINKYTIDNIVKSYGTRLDIYFDYRRSEFTAVNTKDYNNKFKVVYSKYQGRKYSYDVMSKQKDYHDILDAMFNECVKNYIAQDTPTSELNTMVCDMKMVPELRGLCFITAGYLIGQRCAEAVYGDNKSDTVMYVINKGDTVTISGDLLHEIAARFIIEDIEISSSLGYMYYNRSVGTKNADGDIIRRVTDNTSRYGNAKIIKGLPSLMRNFTDFVPISFNWSSYTPFWASCKSFISKLKDETTLGLDMIEVDNLTNDGREMKDTHSTTIYTTRRRLYEVLGEKFEVYNFRFMNEIIAGLFLDGEWLTGANGLYVHKSDTRDWCNVLSYQALTPEIRNNYEFKSSPELSVYSAKFLVSKYWKTMSDEPAEKANAISRRMSTLNLDSIKADVKQMSENSKELFNYVE